MNILFLTLATMENINNQNIYIDLLKQFKNNNHKVYVITPRERRLNKPTEYVIEDGIHVLRVKIGNITKTNLIEKGLSTILIESTYLKNIKKYIKKVNFDIVIYSTPPITFENVIRYIKKRDGANSYLLLKDIFPQNAVDLGMLKKNGYKKFLYKYFLQKERKLYEISDYIGCMSQANVKFLLKQNPEIPSDIVEVCPNSIEPMKIEKDENSIKEIRIKYNIPLDKTVFLYGGNLGKPQGIDFLINCLEANKNKEDIYFIIAGSGTEFHELKTYFDNQQMMNAQLFQHLPKDDYEQLANSCDVGMIFLDKRFTIPNFPSRILSYMQASMPVLAATDVNTDVGEVIEIGKFGFWCESSNVEEFSQKLQQLCDPELRIKMGKNARKYLEDNYAAEHSYKIIMNHFK